MTVLNLADALKVGTTTVDKVYAGSVQVWPSSDSAPTGYAGEVLADNPIAYWRLGETSGTVASDLSGNEHHGTYQGSPTLGVTGLLTGDTDTAVQFDGSNDRVTTANGGETWPNVANLTVEAWIKTSAGGIRSIVDRDLAASGVTRGWQFRLNGANLEFVKIVGGVVVVSHAGAALNNGVRRHLAATYDGTNIRLYIDGALVKTQALGSLLGSNSPVTIGANLSVNFGSPSALFNGTIDEVAYYDTALSATRIAAHYATGTGA